jgi:hypothetical protein
VRRSGADTVDERAENNCAVEVVITHKVKNASAKRSIMQFHRRFREGIPKDLHEALDFRKSGQYALLRFLLHVLREPVQSGLRQPRVHVTGVDARAAIYSIHD